MNAERDKFLTEVMGECWHEWEQKHTCGGSYCKHCSTYWPLYPSIETQALLNSKINFSTWEGFGKLWEWAQNQEWRSEFTLRCMEGWTDEDFPVRLIHPDNFADTLYSFLKENKS